MVAQGRLGFRFPPSGSFSYCTILAQWPPRPTGRGSLGGFRCPTTLRGMGPLNRAIDGLALPNDPAFVGDQYIPTRFVCQVFQYQVVALTICSDVQSQTPSR